MLAETLEEIQKVVSTPLWSDGGAPTPPDIVRTGSTPTKIAPTKEPRRF